MLGGRDGYRRYKALASPSPEESLSLVEEAVSRKLLLVLAGLCEAVYEGRGASEAGPGDKLVIVKPDGSVIVHGVKGFKPLNWQPDTSYIDVSLSGGELVLKFVRRRPREVLVVKCSEIGFVAACLAPVEGAYWMFMSEEEIRGLIVSRPESFLGERIRFLEKEKSLGEEGFADAYGYDEEGNAVVVEVKRVKAGEEAVRQLMRYVERARALRKGRVRGILVAPDITEAARKLLEAGGLEFVRIDLRKAYLEAKRRRQASLEDFI